MQQNNKKLIIFDTDYGQFYLWKYVYIALNHDLMMSGVGITLRFHDNNSFANTVVFSG